MRCRPLRSPLSIALLVSMVCGASAHAQEEAIAEAVEAIAEASSDEGEQAVATPTIRPLTVATGLTDDTFITGTLVDSTSIEIKTAFGAASIPLSEVAGIRFPAADDSSTTVVMLNGDSITGATDLKFVNVETTWGSAKINGQNIASMLFVPGLKWQSAENLGGKRWNLVEATAPSMNGQPQVRPASNSNGRNSVVQPAGGTRPLNPPRIQSGQPQVIFPR